MGGRRADYFDTEGGVTLAQAIVMACRIHDHFCKDAPSLPTQMGDPWYEPYLRYAEKHDLMDFEGLSAEACDRPVSRILFANALWVSMPESALKAIGSVEDNAIPDLASGDANAHQGLSRGAAAALVGRALDPSLRKAVNLKEAPFEPVPLNELANLKSLRRKASDEEMAQAYQAALKVVTPLARLSREEQLRGIAKALRAMFESGIAVALRERFEDGMSYSMETPHYNDPYGYFVLGAASCAGCTRATGLCLNMLGIHYEHVNENQYDHQWCRVNVNGTYWICDAYGLYCGPEPAPYKHPYL